MPNIMDVSNGQKNVIITYDSTFLNSDAIFIEYDDVIKSPFFIYLDSIKNNEALKTIFDLSEISDLNFDELYEWYINRKNQNIFKCLKLQDGVLEKFFNNDIEIFNKWCETVLYESIDTNEYFVKTDTELNFVDSLDMLLKVNIVNKYYIYTPIESKFIKEDIQKRFKNKITYVYGDLKEVLKNNNITANSTFIFSDVSKVLILDEIGLLNLSSIAIADRYGYNYKDSKNIIIDKNNISNKIVFKMDFFNNINNLD